MAHMATTHAWGRSDPDQAAKVLTYGKFVWEVLASLNLHALYCSAKKDDAL